jgi:hypothetical protein
MYEACLCVSVAWLCREPVADELAAEAAPFSDRVSLPHAVVHEYVRLRAMERLSTFEAAGGLVVVGCVFAVAGRLLVSALFALGT